MTTLAIVIQLVIALTIVNVWIFRYSRPTPFRPTGASDMREEFERYGLPAWFRTFTGFAKLSLAALLIAGIWVEPVAPWAAAALAVLMLGAVVAHARVGDPVRKSLPALSILALCVLVVAAHSA
jgi:uncharacterized membrane protein YphA (DoxX/SURF4 family)